MSDFTNSIADALTVAADKIREYGEVARLQALIKAEEAKKQDYYYKLGKKYYELYKDAPASDLAEIMNKLLAADEKIESYQEDLKAASSSSEKYTDVGKEETKEDNDATFTTVEEPKAEASDEVKEDAVHIDETV